MGENGSGILASKFRFFLGRLNFTPKIAADAILATVILHNLPRCKRCELYTSPDFVDELDEDQVIHEGSWR